METATKAPKKKSCIHSQPLSCSTNGKVMEKSWQTPAANYVGTHFSVLVAFIFSHVKKEKKEKGKYVFTSHQSLSHHITVTCQAETTSLLLLTALYAALCVWVRCCFCPHRAAQLSPQSSTLVPGCSSEQVWWWRPRPAWGPAPRRRCWETARTHGSGTLWSSASNGSWEEW